MLVFPVVLAALWCAISFELVVESARTQGQELVLFGNVLAAPAVSVTIVVLCVVSASAALAMAIAVAFARGRRLERRMAGELDARWAALAERDAGDAARKNLLSWRLPSSKRWWSSCWPSARRPCRAHPGCSSSPNLLVSPASSRGLGRFAF